MDDLLRLDGRIVVVSGAGGGGIGTTVTRMAAEAGATVVAVSRSKENLDEHVAPLAHEGLSVVPVAADASTDEGIATVIDQVRCTDGNLYGLVNVAGGAEPSTRNSGRTRRRVRSCRSRRSAARTLRPFISPTEQPRPRWRR